MDGSVLLFLGHDAVTVTLLLAAPVLIATTVVGLGVSVVQAVTQINEMTLTFVPKIISVLAVLGLLGPWMAATLLNYTERLLTALPQLVR